MTDTREETQLLPCPFCGGEKTGLDFQRDGQVVRCFNIGCQASVGAYSPSAAEKAIKRWNTRAAILSTEAAPSEPDTLASAIEETETENYADLVDMANVGKAFMRELANNMPGYSYLQCPSEVICDLINQNFDANAHPPAQPEQADDEPQVTHCPFCNRDPFHRSDSGEAVAVTCCDLGDLLFRGARPEPETVEIAWGDFCKIAEKLVAAKCYAVASQKEVALKNINPAFDELWKNRPWEIHGRSDKDKALGWFTAGVDHALTAQPEAAPSEPLDDKLVYIKPLRTLVRVQTMYADQVRDLCNAPAAPSEPVAWLCRGGFAGQVVFSHEAALASQKNYGVEIVPLYAHPPAQPVQTPAQVSDADGRGKISLRVGTPAEIANYKAAFASMRSPSGQAAMMPMMESVGNNADTIQKLLGDFSTGELFNALLSRINFDGMDPRTFSLAELLGAIEGAEWPKASPTASQPDTTKSATQPSAAEANKETPKWLNGEPYYCSYCGLGGGEYAACEDVRCKLESPAVARLRRDNATAQPDTTLGASVYGFAHDPTDQRRDDERADTTKSGDGR